MPHCGWLLIIPSMLMAQEPQKVLAPTPTTPQRIHLGCSVQRPYTGPAEQWFPRSDSLSDEQIADLEKVLSAHPDDVCTRGYLIAHGHGHVSRRLEHVLWMIKNHPEWDGFLLPTCSAGNDAGHAQYNQIRAAWLQHVAPDQRSGSVLHNAAVFFASREPDYAVALLERAIHLEPDVAFHVEGLGMLFGRAQFRSVSPSFAILAKSIILSLPTPYS